MRALATTVALGLVIGVSGCGGSGTRTTATTTHTTSTTATSTTATQRPVARGTTIAVVLDAHGAAVARLSGDGSIATATADGTGGWFIAGSFRHVGGLTERGLVHVLANGTIDPRWHGSLASSGRTVLVASGGVLYAAGSIGDTDRSRLLALDAATGTPTRALAAPPGPVTALAVEGAQLIVATSTSTVRARPSCIEALDTRSGRVASGFAADVRPAPEQGCISAMRLDGSSLYLGGTFRFLDGVSTPGLAKLDARTGRLVRHWSPPARAIPSTIYDLAPGGRGVAVGGSGPALAMLSDGTGVPVSRWRAPGRIRNPLSVALSGDQLFVAGDFDGALARLSAASGAELPSWHASSTQSADPVVVSGSAALVALHRR